MTQINTNAPILPGATVAAPTAPCVVAPAAPTPEASPAPSARPTNLRDYHTDAVSRADTMACAPPPSSTPPAESDADRQARQSDQDEANSIIRSVMQMIQQQQNERLKIAHEGQSQSGDSLLQNWQKQEDAQFKSVDAAGGAGGGD